MTWERATVAEVSAIEWTDSTVNFWWGCKKVGPGCDHCYAETWAKRFGIPDYEDSGVRRKVKGAIALIRKLQRGAAAFEREHGRRRRVFIQSMSDFFDNAVDPAWRMEAWEEIVCADGLEIQLVTKRISNVEKMVGRGGGPWPQHVGLMVTVVNQQEADRDIPRLLLLKKRLGISWVGLSIEPMQDRIDLSALQLDADDSMTWNCLSDEWSGHREPWGVGTVDWVIVGGESGRDARPVHPWWVSMLQEQCANAGVPFLFKQWGEWAPDNAFGPLGKVVPSEMVMPWGRGDRPRSFSGPPPAEMIRVGKMMAGRSLYGRTHDGFPRTG